MVATKELCDQIECEATVTEPVVGVKSDVVIRDMYFQGMPRSR